MSNNQPAGTNVELETSREIFLEGIRHFEAACYAEARTSFEQALALAPGRPSILANLGITLFHLEQWRDAIPVLKQAINADPVHADAWIYLGLAHEALAEWKFAVDALKKALTLESHHAALWLICGQCQQRLSMVEEAMKSFDQALAIDPKLAPAWSERGTLLRELHHLEEAANCFEMAISLGADPELNAYYLASVRETVTPSAPPRRYVESLFDDYAADFQDHLLTQLRYQGHEVLLRPLLRQNQRYRQVLDLGCGTGLCGFLISPLADSIVGVDVSNAMLAQARQLSVYDDLIHADLAQFLSERDYKADLILAADVFIYVGELLSVFQSVRRLLQPAGCFAFTVELPANDQDIQLLPSLRYAHSETYVRQLADTCGFSVRHFFRAPVRYDQSVPIQGLYIYLDG